MFCKNCGSKIDGNETICPNCTKNQLEQNSQENAQDIPNQEKNQQDVQQNDQQDVQQNDQQDVQQNDQQDNQQFNPQQQYNPNGQQQFNPQQQYNPNAQQQFNQQQFANQYNNSFPPTPKDNKSAFAIASIILSACGIIGCCCAQFGIVLAVLGVIFGVLGLKSSKKNLAVAGIIIGAVMILMGIAEMIFANYIMSTSEYKDFINNILNELEIN